MSAKTVTELRNRYWSYAGPPVEDTILKHPDPVLKHRGWEDDEIFRFIYDRLEPTSGISSLINSSPDLVISILPHKYRILLELKPNDIAKSIIQKIIIDLITDVMQYVYVKPHLYIKPHFLVTNEIDKITEKVTEDVMEYTGGVTTNGAFRYKFITEEVTQVLESMFSLAEPSERSINDKISNLTELDEDRDNERAIRNGALPYLLHRTSDLVAFYKKVSKTLN